MSNQYRFRRQAVLDVDRISDRIARDNLVAGDRFITAVENACKLLASMPGLGGPFESENPRFARWRVFSVPKFENYLICYLESSAGIDVIRVVYAGMDLDIELARS